MSLVSSASPISFLIPPHYTFSLAGGSDDRFLSFSLPPSPVVCFSLRDCSCSSPPYGQCFHGEGGVVRLPSHLLFSHQSLPLLVPLRLSPEPQSCPRQPAGCGGAAGGRSGAVPGVLVLPDSLQQECGATSSNTGTSSNSLQNEGGCWRTWVDPEAPPALQPAAGEGAIWRMRPPTDRHPPKK